MSNSGMVLPAAEKSRSTCADETVFDAIESELRRQQDQIELIASKNIVSGAMLAAPSSVLTN